LTKKGSAADIAVLHAIAQEAGSISLAFIATTLQLSQEWIS